ncbi:hypothetical protein [Dictyobacter arantiisoli]|uniref:Uncharacterized protein n=1 Tax=Dictyobacter arantiisoli TaxID=2014874 RepID=A0A5A5TBL4_9CHLR|nr:hypothetical protein [Dictyobacter arantiisoli]GCF08871.1 hypothetical protein KDI_24350 [Dictyobacter arantiisoli]
MTQRQGNVHSQQRYTHHWHRRHPLLQHHPVLVSLTLISVAILLAIVSYSADSLFPVLAFIGASPTVPGLLLACVLGTCGILTSIINIIEHVEHGRAYAVLSPEAKEQRYDL